MGLFPRPCPSGPPSVSSGPHSVSPVAQMEGSGSGHSMSHCTWLCDVTPNSME